MSCNIKRGANREPVLIMNGEITELFYGNILDVSVPADETYEDKHVQV
jgi:hypothetical protein